MNQHERIMLDIEKYHPGTRKWDVPILRLAGVKSEELYIDGDLIPLGEYSVSGNNISLSKNRDIKKTSKAYIIVGFNPTNMLITFWLPIVVALIGFLGTIGQPILHNLGVLYQQKQRELRASVVRWEYEIKNDQFTATVMLEDLSDQDRKNWDAYVAVRAERKELSERQATYKYVSLPFPLQKAIEMAVKADKVLTKELQSEHLSAQGLIFLANKDLKIAPGFRPADYPANSLRVLAAPTEGPF